MNERCGNCRFYRPLVPSIATMGTCRVRSVPSFPDRTEHEWCGEYQPARAPSFAPPPTPGGFDGVTPLTTNVAGHKSPPPPGQNG